MKWFTMCSHESVRILYFFSQKSILNIVTLVQLFLLYEYAGQTIHELRFINNVRAYRLISTHRRITFYLFLKYNGLLFTFDPKWRPSKVYQSPDFDRLPICIELSLIPLSLFYIKRRKPKTCELHHCYFTLPFKKSGPQKGGMLKNQTFVS